MISKFSVKKPYTVLVGVILAVVLGVVSFTRMTADLLPSISLPYVIVMTTYPGASPETVELAVTQPVEAAMATVSNIEGISSVSNENYSMVILEFAQTADMNAVSLEIRESLDQITSYWDDAIGSPIIMKLNPDMLPVMIAAVGVEGMDNGDISTYVQDTVIPELESLEGVASVNGTGLLEESVNVVIRKDKVEEMNAKVYAAIDGQMAEARQELEDGKKQLEESRRELEDGNRELVDNRQKLLDSQQELADSRQELEDGRQELEDGKKQLEEQQDSISAQLAAQKTALLSAKSKLETLQSDLTTAQTLDASIKKMKEMAGGEMGIQALKSQEEAINALADPDTFVNPYAENIAKWQKANERLSVSSGDADAQRDKTDAETAIKDLKTKLSSYTVLTAMLGRMDSTGAITGLGSIDPWYSEDTATVTAVTKGLAALQGAASSLKPVLNYDSMVDSLNAMTMGLGYDAYAAQVFSGLASQNIKNMTDLNNAVNSLSGALTQIEQGQMSAAIEFANGKASIALGEYQLELAQTQLDAGEDQIQSGLDQLDDAAKQLEDAREQLKDAEAQLADGEEQFADAKEAAYEQADMGKTLTVDTITGLLTAQNFSMPAGYVTEEGTDYLVRVGDKPETVEELKELPLMDLHMDGVPVITLGDVADVFYTDNSDEIYANVNGSPGVMLTIQKQTGYSTGEVSDRLGERFAEMMAQNGKLSLITLMDQGIYIDLVMDSILDNILYGAVLAVLILLLFLKDLRPTLVVALSIPVSLVTAIVCMYFSGVTLNVISLSGLALGIGMLVDNSIVVIENIYRLRSEGASVQEAAIQGAKEVAGAILASTLTTVCVFLPIVFTEGITRQLFVDMGLTIAYSLMASLLIALTVVPAMSSKLLGKTRQQKEGRIYGVLLNGYEKVLKGALRAKPLVLLLVAGLLAASAALALRNGTAFMADMDSTQLTVSVTLDQDATLQETGAVADQVAEAILSIEDVQDVGAMTSTSTMSLLGGGSGSTNAATIYVVTREDKKKTNEEIADIIYEKTAGMDAQIQVDTSSMDMSAMGGSGISIEVRGRDLDTIQRIAQEVAAVVESVEGTAEVSDGLEEAKEELRVTVRREDAVHYGLTVAQVYTQLYTKLAEAGSATTLVAADKDYNVYVKNESDLELTRSMLQDIPITGTDEKGESVEIPLQDIADLAPAQALTSINRADQTRYVAVSAAIADGYNVGLVSAAVEEKLADYELPAGYQLVFSGENEMIVDAMRQVLLMLTLALLFMYLIMVAQFQSLLSPFIIMFTIPLAFTGGFLGLWISGSEVSVIAMIGFVMLSGIIVNNGIVLIDYMNQLRESGMEKREAILTAGRTRMRPVLMTALTTILGLSTMVFSQDMGSEMARPMAVVTIGGLFYGTLLTLVVIPCIYDLFIREKKEGRKAKLRRIPKRKRQAEED